MAKERILVVEDDDDILQLFKYNLAKEGYTATVVASGEEALKAVKLGVPDLILLDLRLPGIDGLKVCRLLKRDERTGSIPIIMLTTKGMKK